MRTWLGRAGLAALLVALPLAAAADERIGATSFIVEWGEPPTRVTDAYRLRRSAIGRIELRILRVARDPQTGWEFRSNWALEGPCAPLAVELSCPADGPALLSFRLGAKTCLDLHFPGEDQAAIPQSDAPQVLSFLRDNFRRVETGMGLRFRDRLTPEGACPR